MLDARGGRGTRWADHHPSLEGTFEVSHRIRSIAAVAVLAAAFTLTACSEDDSSADNEAAACAAVETLRAKVQELGTLTAESTVDQIREVRDGVKSAYSDLVSNLGDVAEDREDQLDEAFEAFSDGVDDVKGSATVGEALGTLTEEAAGITSAETALSAELGCKG